MYLVSKEIIRQIMTSAQQDQEHQMLLARCLELEESYRRVILDLSEDDREIIDAYFLACTQMQLDLLRVAYTCGTCSRNPWIPR